MHRVADENPRDTHGPAGGVHVRSDVFEEPAVAGRHLVEHHGSRSSRAAGKRVREPCPLHVPMARPVLGVFARVDHPPGGIVFFAAAPVETLDPGTRWWSAPRPGCPPCTGRSRRAGAGAWVVNVPQRRPLAVVVSVEDPPWPPAFAKVVFRCPAVFNEARSDGCGIPDDHLLDRTRSLRPLQRPSQRATGPAPGGSPGVLFGELQPRP